MPNLNQQFRYKTSNFSMQFFSLLSYMLKNQAEFLKLDSIHQFMLPSKSCKTINANFLLKNFGLTFFDRFKTGTYLVNWFGRGSAEPCRTSKFGRYRCRFIGRSLVLGFVRLSQVINLARFARNVEKKVKMCPFFSFFSEQISCQFHFCACMIFKA